MAIAYSPQIVTNGLSLYIDAGNAKSYPGSGATWVDLSGNGLNWTLVNSPTYNSSGYFRFNGTTQYAERASFIQSFDNTNNTFSVWFRPVSTPAGNRPVWSDNFGPELGVWIDNLNDVRSWVYANAPVVNVPNNTWVNVAFTYFANAASSGLTYQVSTYINGVLTEENRSGTVGNGLNDIPLNIARDPGQPTLFSNIDVSIWQHYNRRLTGAEIRQNFNAIRGRYGI